MPAESADAPTPALIEATIFELIAARRPGATICPSDVARVLAPDQASWRALMSRVREVAQALAEAGRLRVTRSGVEVSALQGGGPIRLGRPERAPLGLGPKNDKGPERGP